MRTNLLETYSRQLKVAEAYVAKNFDGKTVSANTQLTTAVLLDNTNRWMTESMNSSMVAGGARADLGDWKKFCLNLTNIAVPSLIANDLVIVHPMTSYSGSVAYLKYVAASDKNGMKDTTLNSVFAHGEMNDARMFYASPVVVESITEAGKTALTPIEGGFVIRDAEKANGTAIEGAGTYTYKVNGEYTNDTSKLTVGAKVAYKAAEGNDWQMEKVPATKIPAIAPKMERIALVAEPRRIAVKYDQITAFQAKTDYGFSLDKQIAEQACGELAYEIDTEIVDMLYKAAFAHTKVEDGATVADILVFDKTQPIGVSKFEHYNAFLEIVEEAKAIIYNRTRKFHPNYMVIGSKVLPVLRFVNGFTAVKNAKMNGPYKVGELDGLDVYVSPAIDEDEFFFGLNGSDMMSSAGVYAPYMAIVPTQLLGTPDGALQQGFSTWYAKALLNDLLLVGGRITGGGVQAHN